MQDLIKLHETDDVAVALHPLTKGEVVKIDGTSITINEAIEQGHKLALHDIVEGSNVIKYGFPIGHTTKSIKQGDWVHTHNMATNLSGELKYTYTPHLNVKKYQKENRTFKGYRRKNGQVGVRNDLYIVPTVGCISGIANIVREQFVEKYPDLGPFSNISILSHPYGCSQLGDDFENTRTILMDAVKHPNAGGVLVFGLGCENNIVDEFKEQLGEFDNDRVKFLVAQKVIDEVDTALDLLDQLVEAAKEDKREPIPISELNIGLKCGGSDGFSGITANPLLGAFSDYLVSQGGSTVLTEVPEMFGAETVLMGRAKNEEIFNKIVHLINDFKDYFLQFNQPVYENPSPGNKAGGITTLEDKSLGCTQKSGTSVVNDVLLYGEKLRTSGLNLLEGPGNDLVATSALASADCHIILFTTGRGTPFGNYVPTIKVATNNQLFEKKKHWMDFNAGQLLDRPMEEVLEEFIDYIIEIASGTQTNNEKNNIRDLTIFKTGVTE
ncbi:altronate dehydratase family protein [Melissococcus plutonius]|uniref:Altronate dehydratase n=1 Tax=Melissococcus plutonius TaxID=33970 RepID=A0A2Z5Y3N1_9ENTE|nr:altronate dehydratase family protein [Melissococcus plutonius]BAL62626.1 altronate hydrolase [Melissococcus plutonius DAT561]MCV2498551.1 altronate dehydratase family protein [Melissococcus plutonius]MCV2501284.1 altronate dehydratase family protein [Melissococcus plutonius]MCV2504781.1 altronate dehydratase family protein [Melissococcus plutonius]MCV2507241.1 altronate dehydratase family protein [Melissococcus plutonius]